MINIELVELSKIEVLRLIHLFTCLFGGLFLVLTWYRAKKIAENLKQDLGLIFIACALFLWVAMDLYRFLGFMKPGYVSLVIKTFSAYNNAFFLASLPFFSYSFGYLKDKFPLFQNKMKWAIFVLLTNIGFVFFYSIFWGEKQETSLVVNYFDFIYSTITYVFLGYAIVQSFYKRPHYRHSFFYISLFLTFLLIITQIGFAPFIKMANYDILSVTAFTSQCLLIFIFIFLGQAWIIDYNQEVSQNKNSELEEKLAETEKIKQSYKTELEKIKSDFESLNLKTQSLETNLLEKETTIKTAQDIKELSERELEVLSLIDKSYSEIGNLLHIARETVISHKKNIESKLGISNKIQLIEYASKIGILKK